MNKTNNFKVSVSIALSHNHLIRSIYLSGREANILACYTQESIEVRYPVVFNIRYGSLSTALFKTNNSFVSFTNRLNIRRMSRVGKTR